MIILILFEIIFFTLISMFGKSLLKRITKEDESKDNIFRYFWFGLSILILFSELISLFFPLNQIVFISFFIIVFIIGIFEFNINTLKIINPLYIIPIIFVFLSHSWINQPIQLLDTLGYHLNMVKWNHDFGVVTGLVNLQDRFGFNSSFWVLSALFDNLYFHNKTTYVLNISLITIVSFQLTCIIVEKSKSLLKFYSSILLIFIYTKIDSIELNSLSSDLPMQILIIVVCLEIIRNTKNSIHIALIISSTVLTIKLSGITFFIVISIYYIYKFLFKKFEDEIKLSYFSIIISFLIILFFIIRNIYISGTLVYPLALLNLHLPWSQNDQSISELSNTITAWARLPGKYHMTSLKMNFFEWFVPWLNRNIGSYEITISGISILLIILNLKKIITFKKENTLIIVSAIFSILLTILKAPDLRFSSIFFWLFFISTLSVIKDKFILSKSNIIFLFIIILIFSKFDIVLKNTLTRYQSIYFEFFKISEVGSLAVDEFIIPLNQKIYKPRGNDCGNSNLPCTSIPPNRINLINVEKLSDGFLP